LFNKTLVIGIILFFIFISITPSTAVDTINKSYISTDKGNTLYVGGSGPDNYSIIQDAVDDAEDGDTVFVFDDSSPYIENLIVNKAIELVGEDKYTTIIDGNKTKDVVKIVTDGVILIGFLIKNGTNGIQIFSKNNTINANIITDNKFYGIILDKTCYNVITGNNISNNGGGIEIWESRDNIVIENEIVYNIGNYVNFGIYLSRSDCNNISNNFISSSPINIHLSSSNENIISQNVVSKGRHRGIQLHFADDNTILRNTISSTFYVGLQIESKRNKVLQNNFINNTNHSSFTFIFKTVLGLNFNKWDGNYWDDWIGHKNPLYKIFPKIIKGILTRSNKFPILAFDWHPAKEPYKI